MLTVSNFIKATQKKYDDWGVEGYYIAKEDNKYKAKHILKWV